MHQYQYPTQSLACSETLQHPSEQPQNQKPVANQQSSDYQRDRPIRIRKQTTRTPMITKPKQINTSIKKFKTKITQKCQEQGIPHTAQVSKQSSSVFSREEDVQILNLVHEHGPKFNFISKRIPGKSMNMIKNRYYKLLRYQWSELLGITKPEPIPNELDVLIDKTELFPDLSEIVRQFIGQLAKLA